MRLWYSFFQVRNSSPFLYFYSVFYVLFFNLGFFCSSTFCRRDSFITHRAFCDALAEESAKAQPQSLVDKPVSNSSQKAVEPVEPNPKLSPPPSPPAAASPPQSACVLSPPVLPIQSQGKVNNCSASAVSFVVYCTLSQ